MALSEDAKDEQMAAVVLLSRSLEGAQALLEQGEWTLAAKALETATYQAKWLAWRFPNE